MSSCTKNSRIDPLAFIKFVSLFFFKKVAWNMVNMSEIHEAPIIHGAVSVASCVTGSVTLGSSVFNSIDTELNSGSNNPLTNAAVKEALNGAVKPTFSAFSVKLIENVNTNYTGDITFSGVTQAINTFNASTTTINYSVTYASVGGGNKYVIDGQQQPTLELIEGNTYVFNWSAAPSHPFRFSTTSNGIHATGGEAYTTGVTVDDLEKTTTITVAALAPTLFYYCHHHSGMGGQANTPPSSSSMNLAVTYASVGGESKYFIDGQQQATLELMQGNTYVFDWSSAPTHPFRFSTYSDGTHASGAEYTTGVTVDDSNQTTTIVVAASTPTLFYYCHHHSGMGGLVFTPSITTQGSTQYILNNQTVTTPTSGTYVVTSTTNAATQSNTLIMSLKVNDLVVKSSVGNGVLNMSTQLFLQSGDIINLHSDNDTPSKSTFSVTLIKADQIY